MFTTRINQYNLRRLNFLRSFYEPAKTAVAGAQILFVAFGAMVLVPLLTGLNPALALLGAGLGTLLFQLVTKRKVPIFLGSSFAFIAPIIYSVKEWGLLLPCLACLRQVSCTLSLPH